MTKAELIRKVAKNVGVPDSDAKIFFELFLKRISALVEIGQSIFVKDFGYFHLIKGSIKKAVPSVLNNEISEEAVEFVLFSEDKDLRRSDTKGLVFNIPFFDEEDYHPIDSAFSLSIGKPLIPLRGVPFDNIYMPASGYEYRRLIESKVEKIIAASEIAESKENFPTLVIDASSYNSNQVQLQWDDKSKAKTGDQLAVENEFYDEPKTDLSEYEKQKTELKNIAWDFGEDLSRQIEAESILDIADERMNMELTPKTNKKMDIEEISKVDQINDSANTIKELIINEIPEVSPVSQIDESSEKLNELLEGENELNEIYEDEVLDKAGAENLEADIQEVKDEVIDENTLEEDKSISIENDSLKDELADEEFWKSTSKYFEPYKPETEKDTEEKFEEVESNLDNLGVYDSDESDQKRDEEINEYSSTNLISADNSVLDENAAETQNVIEENYAIDSNDEDNIELEKENEKQNEYFEPVKKRNLIPFIVFPLLVIGLSIALYWYLEFYKKNETAPIVNQISLNSNNAKIIQRNFDIPVTYPYLPKIKETTISETVAPSNEDKNLDTEKNEVLKSDQKIVEDKKVEKQIPNQTSTETKEPVKRITSSGKSLNVGNNIYKYDNYFVVQVAAFRSISISENEAGKYRNKGYNAFVEAAEIPDRGTWYRVRVGNFSTKEEAQIFANKNIR